MDPLTIAKTNNPIRSGFFRAIDGGLIMLIAIVTARP